MKTSFLLFGLLSLNTALLAQNLLTNPNKFIKGKKEGLWSEFELCEVIDFDGKYHLRVRQHYVPVYVVAEGNYVHGERQGFWKTYWIDSTSTSKKGSVKSIVEYLDNTLCGPIIEYYETGNIKAICQVEVFPYKSSGTLHVPDWNKDPEGGKLKDTVIYSKWGNRVKNDWIFFLENGQVYKKD